MPELSNSLAARSLDAVYGLLAMALFLAFGLLACLLVLLPMGVAARRQVAHKTARAYFWSVGMPVQLHGAHNLPDGPCVIVANHASYIDGPVLKAALPARFCFVIKKEVSRVPLAGLLLRRIGSEFVDRFNRHAGGMDARRLIKAADSGQALAFFPEGTFLAQPGIGKFHTGAFAIAARAGMPIVPVGVLGTRRILPSGRLLLRRGVIDVHVLPPLGPYSQMDPSAAAALLKEQSRAHILHLTAEPDLAGADGIAPETRRA
ncbi:MAG TPA: lysophospholipid acyltransferase family protein [Steroidobacter sp.]|jgi:1-acyl-sn-glycerol-3-phosphate acyltransferase|nr:lysophospholipid acyltransferase family protein [Steroidobacter sp.]